MDYTGAADIGKAFYVTWLVVSAAVFFALVTPLFVPAASLEHVLPPCEWQARYGQPCPLCGMTTAFYHISRGEMEPALSAHPASVIVYLLFLVNTLLAGLAAVKPSRLLCGRRATRIRNNMEELCKLQH